MIREVRCIVMDIDETLCPIKKSHQNYDDVASIAAILANLHEYVRDGFYVILSTTRSMRIYGGTLGKIYSNTGRAFLQWLEKYHVPYDELHLREPWHGRGGSCVDDQPISPTESVALSYDEILVLLQKHIR